MPFVLTPAGLQTQTQEEIQAEILSRLQVEFGPTLNTSLQSVSGQFARVVAEMLAGYQQQVLALEQSLDPNAATGVQLSQRAALTGSVKRGETYSTVRGVLIAIGACAVPDGATVRNDTYQTVWEVIGGPYVFVGAGSLDATVRAVVAGPLQSFADDPWTITSPIVNLSQWTTPVEDATPGRLIESDPMFRARRTGELFAAGQGPLAAISGAVLRISGVAWARAFHNPSENPVGTDPDRNIDIPYKQYRLVVKFDESPPSADLITEVCETMWQQQGAGVVSYGTDYSEVIIDPEGQGQLMAFDEVETIDCYLKIIILTSNADEPIIPFVRSEMADMVAAASVARAAQVSVPGRDFRALDYVGAITKLITDGQLSGVSSLECFVSYTDVFVGSTTNLTITIAEEADLDSGEILVVIDGEEFSP